MGRFRKPAVLVALLLVACSRAAEIPRDQVGAEEYRKPGSYRIRLHGWNEYYARRFSMTDSTVVIEELTQSDDRYKLMRHDMPIVIPLADVVSISEMQSTWVTKPLLITSAVLVVATILIIATWDLSFE